MFWKEIHFPWAEPLRELCLKIWKLDGDSIWLHAHVARSEMISHLFLKWRTGKKVEILTQSRCTDFSTVKKQMSVTCTKMYFLDFMTVHPHTTKEVSQKGRTHWFSLAMMNNIHFWNVFQLPRILNLQVPYNLPRIS